MPTQSGVQTFLLSFFPCVLVLSHTCIPYRTFTRRQHHTPLVYICIRISWICSALPFAIYLFSKFLCHPSSGNRRAVYNIKTEITSKTIPPPRHSFKRLFNQPKLWGKRNVFAWCLLGTCIMPGQTTCLSRLALLSRISSWKGVFYITSYLVLRNWRFQGANSLHLKRILYHWAAVHCHTLISILLLPYLSIAL